MKKFLVIAIAGFVFLVSCKSTTVITSEPSGAKVYMDGQKKGTTPYTHTDTKIAGSETNVTLKLDGYEDKYIVMKRDEKADVGAIVAGCFVLIPLLWCMEYQPEHNYEMEPKTEGNPGLDIKPDTTEPTTENPNRGNDNSTTELIKLKGLLDEGAITEDDFTTLKVKILNEEYDYENSASEEIKKLKELKDQGLLTEAEYNSQKAKVINK